MSVPDDLADADAGAPPFAPRLIPWRYAGMALYVLWDWCLTLVRNGAVGDAAYAMVRSSTHYVFIFEALVLLVAALMGNRSCAASNSGERGIVAGGAGAVACDGSSTCGERASDPTTRFFLGPQGLHTDLAMLQNHVLVTCLLLGVLGTAVATVFSAGAVPPTEIAMLVQVLVGACIGAGKAALLLAWACACAALGPGQVFLFGAASLVVAGGGFFLAAALEPRALRAVTVLVPLAGAAYALLGLRYARAGGMCAGVPLSTAEGPTGAAFGAAVRQPSVVHGASPSVPTMGRFSFPWKPVLVMSVYGLMAAFVDVALFKQGPGPHVVAVLAVGAVLVGYVIVLRRRMRPVGLVGAAYACVALGVLAVAFLGDLAPWAASFLVMCGYVLVTFFTYSLLVNLHQTHGAPIAWLFGLAGAVRTIADHAGGYAQIAFPGVEHMAGSPLALAVVAVAGMSAVAVVAAVWASERSFASDWAVRDIDLAEGRRAPTEREVLMAGYEVLVTEYSLTEREADVLRMLVEGMSYQQMCDSLILSLNTMKSHARRMYAKLGLHSREEVVALAFAKGAQRFG